MTSNFKDNQAADAFVWRTALFAIISAAFPLIWLWWVLINHLRVEWTLNEQYGYGTAVPFLCILLLWRRIQNQEPRTQKSEVRSQKPEVIFYLLIALCAVLYFPTRLLQEPNPDWRLVSWALALEVLGITLLYFRLSDFGLPIGRAVFPLLFVLVAVPWPTFVEYPLTQSLMRLDVDATTGVMGWLGIPSIAHGNVIEVAKGMVGIDEACSGIRSLQATLMIALFLGEWWRLNPARRWGLILIGFGLSQFFNFVRLMMLVGVAAHAGIAEMNRWHDPTGLGLLLGCFSGLWLAGHFLSPKNRHLVVEPKVFFWRQVDYQRCNVALGLALGVWLLVAEAAVQGWYRWHEARLPAPVTWRVDWPTNVHLQEVLIAPKTRQILRCDEAQYFAWQASEHDYQVVFMRWNAGTVAVRLAREHTPATCLPTAGQEIVAQSDLVTISVKGLALPFRFFEVKGNHQRGFLAYCLWEDRAPKRDLSAYILGRMQRFIPVWAGERNLGQRCLEISISGVNDFAEFQTALEKLLDKIIKPEAGRMAF